MAYLLDANVFIEAKNFQYGFDFCPAFWDWLLLKHSASELFSVERVGDELLEQEDQLTAWARARGPAFFRPVDETVLPSLSVVSQWVNGRADYELAAKTTFLRVADYYLVAAARAGRHVVVTHEVPSNSPRRIKVPNVCAAFNLECINTYTMLRRERVRFILDAGR